MIFGNSRSVSIDCSILFFIIVQYCQKLQDTTQSTTPSQVLNGCEFDLPTLHYTSLPTFFSHSWQTYVVKIGSDSSSAKRSAIGLSAMGPRRWRLETNFPGLSSCRTLKNPHYSITMSAAHRSALHQQSWRLHMSEKFSSGNKNPNKQQLF